MKTKYYIVIVLLIIIGLAAIFLIKTDLLFSDWIASSAMIGATVAALITGVIALGASDKPPRKVKFEIHTEIDQNHKESDTGCLCLNTSKGVPTNGSIDSYRVYFRIKNLSGFTLNKPVVTFRLPLELGHPMKDPQSNLGNCIPTFNTNLYNVQKDLRHYAYDNIFVLSNNVLPYLNNNQEHPIWIRMCLTKNDDKPWKVIVDINCDNAEGDTKEVEIYPI